MMNTLFYAKNAKPFEIRRLTETDAASFLTFMKQVEQDSTHTMRYVGMPQPSIEEQARRLKLQQEDNFNLSLGVFDQGSLVGYLHFYSEWKDHPWIKHAARFAMMVLKDHWNLGIGKKLLELQDSHAKNIGVVRIEALVRSLNENAIKLYLHHGFKIEGTRNKASKIDGIFQDEFFIAKILDEESKEWIPPTLKTDRLILRPITLDDAEGMYEYAKNPNVSKYTLWEPHQSIQNSRDSIKNYVFTSYRNAVPEPLAITLKDNPAKMIGTVGCGWVSKKHKCMELAYALSEEFWGQGLAAEAARALMNYCFQEYDVKRIQAHFKSENIQSGRVMEKIGMNYEGELKSAKFYRNRFWDMKIYAKVVE